MVFSLHSSAEILRIKAQKKEMAAEMEAVSKQKAKQKEELEREKKEV